MGGTDDSEFKARLANALARIAGRPPLTIEEVRELAAAEEACVCKHCGRCVLAGPPCCSKRMDDLREARDARKREQREAKRARKLQRRAERRAAQKT